MPFGKRRERAGFEISMGSVGDCYDNAVCEAFHASIKKERIYRQSWPTRGEARAAVFEYIEGWYNPRRRHSTLDYLSPLEFERQHAERLALPLEGPNSGNGSAASTAPRASHGLTTRRVSTVGVDLAAHGCCRRENRGCFARRAAVELALPLGRRSRSVVGTRETLGCPSIDADSWQAAK